MRKHKFETVAKKLFEHNFIMNKVLQGLRIKKYSLSFENNLNAN